MLILNQLLLRGTELEKEVQIQQVGNVFSHLLPPTVETLTCYLQGEYGGGLAVFLLLLIKLQLCCWQAVNSCEAGIGWALLVCVCGWCAHMVLSGVGDSLPRNCCCFKFLPRNYCCLKFQQSWNWTKQALPCGCACGKGKSDDTRGKINFHVLEVCQKKLQK